jgi:hypothetical protein
LPSRLRSRNGIAQVTAAASHAIVSVVSEAKMDLSFQKRLKNNIPFFFARARVIAEGIVLIVKGVVVPQYAEFA